MESPRGAIGGCPLRALAQRLLHAVLLLLTLRETPAASICFTQGSPLGHNPFSHFIGYGRGKPGLVPFGQPLPGPLFPA